ncbi:hypothetical protein PROFUN_04953 [Planoprotostelium fungivorum]|uniref:Centrosomin N-terminal motif 1 domain-containing protein n=1 Tax=Planoprotostelium fungivorum TaxID=1890364 RepID=A0A2P6NSN4_9EUKA|nr:hypothetical protein PROFUN_04953 [Planoprotostelium fungivorum]
MNGRGDHSQNGDSNHSTPRKGPWLDDSLLWPHHDVSQDVHELSPRTSYWNRPSSPLHRSALRSASHQDRSDGSPDLNALRRLQFKDSPKVTAASQNDTSFKEMESTITNLRIENFNLRMMITNMEEQQRNMFHSYGGTIGDEELHEILHQNNGLRTQMCEMKNILHLAKEEIDRLSLIAAGKSSNGSNPELENELQEAIKEAAESNELVKKLVEENEALEQELSEEKSHSREDHDVYTRRIEELSQQLKEREEEKEKIERESEENKSVAAEALEELEKSQQMWREREERFKEKEKSLMKRLTILNAQCEKNRNQESVDEQRDMMQEALQNAHKQILQLESELEHKRDQDNGHAPDDDAEEMRQKLMSMSLKLDLLFRNEDHQNATHEEKELFQGTEEEEELLHMRGADLKTVTSDILRKIDVIQQLSDRSRMQGDRINGDLRQKNRLLENQREENDRKMRELTRELSSQSRSLNRSRDESKFQDEIERYKQQLHDLHSKLEATEYERDLADSDRIRLEQKLKEAVFKSTMWEEEVSMRHSAAENIEKEKNRRQRQYEEEREDSNHRRESERQNLLTSHKKEIARIREEYAEEIHRMNEDNEELRRLLLMKERMSLEGRTGRFESSLDGRYLSGNILIAKQKLEKCSSVQKKVLNQLEKKSRTSLQGLVEAISEIERDDDFT